MMLITDNGEYKIGTCNSTGVSIKIDGNFGGGSLSIGYESMGQFVPYNDIPAQTDNYQSILDVGEGCEVFVKLVSATSPQINIQIHEVA